MPINPTPNVDCKYGAPLGRPSHNTFTDRQGRTFEITATENAPPFCLRYCPLNAGGAYWGHGAALYYYCNHTGDIDGYVRAEYDDTAEDKSRRGLAKQAVRKIHPHARFYR
jgi:hypothetical protein